MKVVSSLILGILFGFLLFSFLSTAFALGIWEEAPYPELTELTQLVNQDVGHSDFELFFQNVAMNKGAVYAFELMKKADLPFGLDTHLLAHAIGDILYEQEGVGGMAYCTHDFRNACSHTIVIGTLLEYGTEVVDKIRNACQQAPGGSGAYTMCFHGLGHGVLAFNDYDMEKTVEMCRTLGTEEYKNEESGQCVGGAVMEIIGGGGHNREAWEEKRALSLKNSEPLGLCDETYLNEDERAYCYVYITPFILESIGADMGRPSESDFKKVFTICNEIGSREQILRETCFEGLGKEFIGIAGGRDFRNGVNLTDDGYRKIHKWCLLAEVADGISACERSVVGSLYWGGENELSIPMHFCETSLDTEAKNDCYEAVVKNIKLFVADVKYRTEACLAIPATHTGYCQSELLSESTL